MSGSSSNAGDQAYTAVDGWSPASPVSEIGDAYVRRQFIGTARFLLRDLKGNMRSGSKIPLQDGDPRKTHQNQAVWAADQQNPAWYTQLYWSSEHTHPRTGPFRRYDSAGVSGQPTSANRGKTLVTSTDSRIRRDRVLKALEEIISGKDCDLRVFERTVPRIKTVRGKRKKVTVKQPYVRGSYDAIMRDLIASRLVDGFDVEGSDWPAPGDDRVREYFGLGPWQDEMAERITA